MPVSSVCSYIHCFQDGAMTFIWPSTPCPRGMNEHFNKTYALSDSTVSFIILKVLMNSHNTGGVNQLFACLVQLAGWITDKSKL